METRPQMTLAQFEDSASYVEPDWWQTGDGFIYHPLIMDIQGWNVYGHAGNAKLTEAQRVLMIWSDLVGQLSNGGFEQFVYNYQFALKLAYNHIEKLAWPELFSKFDAAFREQAGDPHNPTPFAANLLNKAHREHMINQLELAEPQRHKLGGLIKPKKYSDLSESDLYVLYKKIILKGEMETFVAQSDAIDSLPVVEAEAFDNWFYLKSTIESSVRFIGAYIRSHRDQLCRIID